MPYDQKKDYEEYMSGAGDFAHARLAKKLIDQKREAKKARAMGGGAPMEDMESAAMGAGDEEASETVADEMSESPVDQDLEAASGTEMHEKMTIEVTPEEFAKLKAMRSGSM